MAHFVLFDDKEALALQPLSSTRPLSELRIGIWRIRQKWEFYLAQEIRSFFTRPHLQELYPLHLQESNYLINGAVLPKPALVQAIRSLPLNHALYQGARILALHAKAEDVLAYQETEQWPKGLGYTEYDAEQVTVLARPQDAFALTGSAIEEDLLCIRSMSNSLALPPCIDVLGPQERIFIEPGADIESCFIDTRQGSVYIGKGAKIGAFSVLRGPLALGAKVEVKAGTRLYGPSSIGLCSKVGGELNNVVFNAYSNKGHDGFLGQAFVGEWVNIGADSNNSNLKNTYKEVSLWNYASQSFEPTGLQFCGLIIGDHAKVGINTMFNTGTVVGVGANVFGSNFPPRFIPDFSWGNASNAPLLTHRLPQFLETAELVMARRNCSPSPEYQAMLQVLYEDTAQYRDWEQKAASLEEQQEPREEEALAQVEEKKKEEE